MAWYPNATHVPIKRVGPEIQPVGVVFHTAVSKRTSFKPYSSTTWHFYINRDGKVYQYVDTERVAYCQLDGNYFNGKGFISIETWDGASTDVWPDYQTNHSGGPAWTPAQVNALVVLTAWLCEKHDFPAIEATHPLGTGIGYHYQFTDDDYPRWNGSHACPGTRRIRQTPEIISRVQDILSGTEDDLPPYTEWAIKDRKALANDVAEAIADRQMVDDVVSTDDKTKRTRTAWQWRTARRDSYNQPRRVWRNRLPWWGDWSSDTWTEDWPSGYTAEANLVHTHRLVRKLLRVIDAQQPLLEAAAKSAGISDEVLRDFADRMQAITARDVIDMIDVDVELGVDDAPPSEDEQPESPKEEKE